MITLFLLFLINPHILIIKKDEIMDLVFILKLLYFHLLFKLILLIIQESSPNISTLLTIIININFFNKFKIYNSNYVK